MQVDLDPQALSANGLSGNDVVAAIGAQNLILPAGTQKIGALEYFIKVNSSPLAIDDLNNLPIRAHNGTVTYVRDVAHVRDGYAPQTNIVRLGGRRALLMNVLKTGKASTIDIINSINAKLPQIRAVMPPDLRIEALSDQSVFVRAAISGVIREAVIAGRADRTVDPAVSRQLAQHPDHYDFDSPVDSRLDLLSVGIGRNHQHHDLGRLGAGGGHSGRRCDRDDRKHQLPP